MQEVRCRGGDHCTKGTAALVETELRSLKAVDWGHRDEGCRSEAPEAAKLSKCMCTAVYCASCPNS